MKENVCASLPLILLLFVGPLSTVSCNRVGEGSSVKVVTVPVEQQTDMQDKYATTPFTGGLRLNFQMSGITHIELESVAGFAIAGTAKLVTSARKKAKRIYQMFLRLIDPRVDDDPNDE